MDIPVNAAKPGRRRYLTLVMIFITVVICYVDRANLAVASAHIQEEFGITKAEMGYVFSAFAWLYTLCQIPGGWFLYVWSVCRSGVFDSAADLDSGDVELALGVHCHWWYRHYLVADLV